MASTAAATFNYKVVRQFSIMTVVWGIVGMLVGVIIAAQLLWPEILPAVPWLSYGRLRPLHTNAVIFAFGGSALFATSYYVVQRTCHVRLFSDALAAFTFWGWNLVIVLAAVTLPLGITTSKEYAELEWPIDILITLVWVAYAVVFFGTLAKRKTPHIYVANWFFGAFILTVALLHVVNSAAIPVTMTKSYSAYPGVQDAMVQWWYGHNAVGFFLTAGFLGMMYYFVPKQAGRPVYSYRLSVVHFWALIFTYMWAGPHHLHYTALPDWTQSLGMVFSLILLAPSWGGMINGIMTLSGAWHKLRDDPILKFLIVSLSFYGMSTFEGPMMSVKTVNALSHYTDWTIGHVHSGALGWVAFISIGSMYYLIPRMFGKEQMYSTKLINAHFWIGTIGVVLYIAVDVDRRRDAGPDVARGQSRRDAHLRVRREREGHVPVLRDPARRRHAVLRRHAGDGLQRLEDGRRRPRPRGADPGRSRRTRKGDTTCSPMTRIEKSVTLLIVLVLLVVSVGGLVQIVPLFFQKSTTEPVAGLKPYTALQLTGRDVYIREGCYNCHSQMIRPFRAETERYGHYSVAGEFVYDHPFQWGSKRTGPDLARVGGRYSDEWHRVHMNNPRDVVPESNMPAYPWLAKAPADAATIQAKMRALRTVGVPYPDDQIAKAPEELKDRTELDALIAYLQGMGLAMRAAK